MDGVFADAVLTLPESWTGSRKTSHIRSGINVTEFVTSVIVGHYDGDPGFYLFYQDAAGNELNDLYFDSRDDAISHLKFEFGEDALRFLVHSTA